MNTIEKLDMLAEYHSQKDGIEAQKRALLDEVKIPAEVLDVQEQAQEKRQSAEYDTNAAVLKLRAECERALSAIVVPDEVKTLMAELDQQRGLVLAYQREKEANYRKRLEEIQQEIYKETQAKTAQVYRDVEKRKREIEAEFSGSVAAVDENIKALEAEIKAEAKDLKQTVKGKYFMAVYVKGRVTWNTDMLDGMIALVPQLEKARKEGEPSITLRRV
jgi:hypothetical protein